MSSFKTTQNPHLFVSLSFHQHVWVKQKLFFRVRTSQSHCWSLNKENPAVLASPQTEPTLKRHIQPLTTCFWIFVRERRLLSSQWTLSHSTANQKAFAFCTEVKSVLREDKSQSNSLYIFIHIILLSFLFKPLYASKQEESFLK